MIKKISAGTIIKNNMEPYIGFAPEFKDPVTCETEGGDQVRLIAPYDVRTTKLNKRAKLKNWEAIYFQIPVSKTITNGSSIPVTLLFIFALLVILFTNSPIIQMIALWFALIAYLIKSAEWSFKAGVIHDHLWGERYIDAWVLDKQTGKLTKHIGRMSVSLKEGNNIMLEKMNSFYANVFGMYIVYGMLEIVRTGKELYNPKVSRINNND